MHDALQEPSRAGIFLGNSAALATCSIAILSNIMIAMIADVTGAFVAAIATTPLNI